MLTGNQVAVTPSQPSTSKTPSGGLLKFWRQLPAKLAVPLAHDSTSPTTTLQAGVQQTEPVHEAGRPASSMPTLAKAVLASARIAVRVEWDSIVLGCMVCWCVGVLVGLYEELIDVDAKREGNGRAYMCFATARGTALVALRQRTTHALRRSHRWLAGSSLVELRHESTSPDNSDGCLANSKSLLFHALVAISKNSLIFSHCRLALGQ